MQLSDRFAAVVERGSESRASTLGPRWVPFALAGCSLALYASIRPAEHTYDAFAIMRDIEIEPSYYFWHPHHLLFTPMAWLAWRGARLFDHSIRCDGLLLLL